MPNKQVKTHELKQSLLDLRASFMNWDNERRKKVDIVLLALKDNGEIVNLDKTLKQIDLSGIQNKDFAELVPAAKKMVRIHYLELSQTDKEKAEAQERSKRARDKLKKFKENGML